MVQNEESFRLRDEGAKHCYFVISKEDSDGNVLVVNRSTYRGLKMDDPTCILSPGDHPSVTQTSYIVYRYAKIMKYTDVLKLNPVKDVSLELYERIRKGVIESEHTPMNIVDYFNKH